MGWLLIPHPFTVGQGKSDWGVSWYVGLFLPGHGWNKHRVVHMLIRFAKGCHEAVLTLQSSQGWLKKRAQRNWLLKSAQGSAVGKRGVGGGSRGVRARQPRILSGGLQTPLGAPCKPHRRQLGLGWSLQRLYQNLVLFSDKTPIRNKKKTWI